MKNKRIELEVDCIGSQETLTPEEVKKISDYFKRNKLATQKRYLKGSTKFSKGSKAII